MSQFLNYTVGAFSAGLAYASDPRLQMPGFQPNLDGYVVFRPWADGVLWTRTRMFGPEMNCAMITEDATCQGRWDTGPFTLGIASAGKIVGTTKDSTGALLGNCIVQGFVTSTDVFVGQVTSDTAGWFELPSIFVGQQHYLVAYKAAGPDIAGTTVNTIVPTY